MRALKAVPLFVLAFALAACDSITGPGSNVHTPGVYVPSDTTPKLALPPIGDQYFSAVAPSDAYEQIPLFFAPLTFSPIVKVSVSNESVAQFVTSTVSGTIRPGENRAAWTWYATLKLTGYGKTKVTLTLTNVPGQPTTSFDVSNTSPKG